MIHYVSNNLLPFLDKINAYFVLYAEFCSKRDKTLVVTSNAGVAETYDVMRQLWRQTEPLSPPPAAETALRPPNINCLYSFMGYCFYGAYAAMSNLYQKINTIIGWPYLFFYSELTNNWMAFSKENKEEHWHVE